MKGYIYKITSPSGKSYIGQTKDINQRRSDYKTLRCKKQQKIYNSLLKYGWEQHIFEIIETFEHDIFYYEIANALEIYWIKFYDCVKNGLNIQEGGKNSSLTEETKNKISLALIGIPKSKEHNEKVGLANTGKKRTDEQKIKNGLSNIGNTYRKGSSHSDESKNKMRVAKEGKIIGQHPKEWNDKIGIANSIKILCENNNKIYDSISNAARELGLETTKISSVCKNKRSHTKGYKFKYV